MSTIETTFGALVGALPTLRKLAALDLNMRAATSLAKLLSLIDTELKFFEDRRELLVAKYGVSRNATPKEIAAGSKREILAVSPEHFPEFQADLTELLAFPVTIGRAPFDLTGIGNAPISADDLTRLGVYGEHSLAVLPTVAETQA